MGKFISALFLGALAIGLSIYTGSRTIDLMGWMLPASQQVYQWLGLAAFEGGMYFWSYYFVAGAKGTPQRSISICMAIFSIVAVAICTIADTMINAAQSGKVGQLSGSQAQAVIIFVAAAIMLNVAAYFACHILSIDNMRRMREQEAEDKIYDAGLVAISALAPSIAAEAAPHLATEWANRTWQRIVPGVPHQTQYIAAPQKSIDASPAPVNKIVESQPQKKSWLGNPFANWFSKEEEKVNLAQTGIIDSKAAPVNKMPVPSRAPRPLPNIAEARRERRQARFARPAVSQIVDAKGNPITSKKVTVSPPLAPAPKESQGAKEPMKNTPAPGSSGKKRVTARGKTNAK